MTAPAQRLPAGSVLPRHRHAKPYLTLVTRGSYVEAGDHGRFKVGPGDVLIHGLFSAHADWVGTRNDVETFNVELNDVCQVAPLCFSPRFDDVIKLLKTDLPAAKALLLESIRPKTAPLSDWPDVMAKAIRDDPSKSVNYWCDSFGLAPATVSRGFKRTFGVSAAQYRATARARQAYHALIQSDTALVHIADHFRFSDQAHFTRSIRALTGEPPSRWRQIKNLQDVEQH